MKVFGEKANYGTIGYRSRVPVEKNRLMDMRAILRSTEEELYFLSLRFEQLIEEMTSARSLAEAADKKSTENNELILKKKINSIEKINKQLESELKILFSEIEGLRKKIPRPQSYVSFLVKQAWIDFRCNVIDGNWYEAEEDGRWCGPGRISEIILPTGLVGNFTFEIEVTDCISPQNLSGISVMHRNELIAYQMEKINESLDFPILLRFELNSLCGDAEKVSLDFPFQRCPSDLGLLDNRIIGLKIRGILFNSI